MPTNKNRFKLSSVYLAMLTATSLSATALAAEDETSSEEDIEVIEIKGFKGSLKKSINDKKFSQNIKDTINAEDIGKTTDQNIADALGRVTGVTVVSNDGEGSTITVRGADANQNNITLNGQTLTSTDFSQAVDLSSFSADILSKLEVVKTPSADHDEGSLGASVNLVTVRPLDQVESVRSLTLQGRYSDFVDEASHKLQFSISEKFLDETVGIAITAYDETNAYRKDQYRTNNFIESPEFAQAVDQNGNVISGMKAIQPTEASYELFQNESNRQGLSLGIQLLPSDVSELMFDVTYSKQELINTMDAIQARSHANNLNWVEGETIASNQRPPNPSSDPIDWVQINTETYDLEKRLNRYGSGNMVRSDGGTENENLSATLNFKMELTDSLRMETQVGHSASKSESLPNAYTVMQNWYQVPAVALYDAGDAIQPAGIDCTQGDTCSMVYGNSFIDLGEYLYTTVLYDEEGNPTEIIPGNSDNTATTGFNPHDTKSFHLGFIGENDRNVEDTITNAQIDFDFDLDEFGITTIEFGAKVSSRNKMVDDQAYSFTSLDATTVIDDPVSGNPVAVPAGTLTEIRGDIIAGSPIPYDDFMSSLGYGREPATQGWTPIDVFAAKELLLGSNVVRDVDNTRSREVDIDTKAFYFKTNFELMDGQLTGDVGVRYVETEIDARGYSGIAYYEDPNGSDLERDIDRHKLAELADRDLPVCQPINFGTDDPDGQYHLKFQRVDGNGWDTSAGPDPSTWVRIEDQGACHDPLFADYADAVNAFRAGTGPQPNLGDYSVLWQTMWRYADISTSRFYGWDSLPVWDGEGGQITDYSRAGVDNRSLASRESSGAHKYENILPSLNLNYAFSDEFVGRFAVSKTMTRPEIDLLRPGYSVNEGGYWGNGVNNVGRVEMFNTQLEPLESNNLDLSFEWYFNETGMLSLAYFKKDMSNFTDRETQLAYIVDVRDSSQAPTDPNDLILQETDNAADDYGVAGCHPLRATTEFNYLPTDPTTFTDDMRDRCAQMTVTKTVNAKNAKIEGLELGYVQTYDFLPGWMSGLGVSANYTYQDSEYESEYSSINPNLLLPSYPVADTPEHSYNLTTFWEDGGNQIRLSFRGTSDSLVGKDWLTGQYGRSWNQGSIWNEGRNTIDLSASWQVTPDISLTFQAINLTDEAYRTYFTSRTLEVVRVGADNEAGYDFVALEEGNPLEGDAPTHRTYFKYKVGTTYRLGLRVNF